MTDRIDLDDPAEGATEPDERGNRGDWLWREGSESDDPASRSADVDAVSTGDITGTGADGVGDGGEDGEPRPAPHVPRSTDGTPAGIPVEGGRVGSHGSGSADGGSVSGGDGGGATPGEPDGPSGPHGGGADEMTMALTYGAATRLADPSAALAEAARWADWVGIVGDVEAHVINKFQRDHHVDVDFFNGSGTGPAERLAGIDATSMFFADRLVVVGLEGEDEPVAEGAGWEFVPLAEAAGKAGWPLSE